MTNSEIIDLMVEDLKKSAAFKHNTLGVPGFTTNMKRLGVSSPQIKKIVNDWSKVLYDFSAQQWIGLCIELAGKEIFEAQVLSYELLWKNKRALAKLNQTQILELGNMLDNWVSVDSYSTMIAGWHWREGTLPDSQILEWLKSGNHWLRRVAVVCTVSLNLRSKGGTGDTKRTLMVCEKVIDDRNDLIVKALSWALRELSKNDKPAVEDFLVKYQDRLHSRVVREVNAKLETGRKNG
ncbi:DNA alkylation repair protein [Maribellus maritimus]|uniref:DNA alkylation repair protein n=1 Tax=Maribellus maritimus TaxID=2870838 RepID=UPI001EEC9508|nr:DNA alkylation repair protein [Maribellus maritimus]MCG6188714.1 DNA alkylation repair protein [Maribellus maritimus]